MKKQKGITLISLIITIVLLLIITGTTVYTSMNRFKINSLKKMYNDIELLNDKISNYYLKYGGLPVLKNENNEPIKYTYKNVGNQKYTPVEYIESTGTQYIDTGIVPNDNTKLEVEGSFENVSDYGTLAGTAVTGKNSTYFGSTAVYGGTVFYYYNSYHSISRLSVKDRFNSILESNGNSATSTFYNKTTDSTYTNTTNGTLSTTYSVTLFALNSGSTVIDKSSAKIYSCKITQNNQLVRDFIPVLDENGVACMYDKVEDKYYYNKGTGDFLYGEEIANDFKTDVNDNENYYIIDLGAIGNITLNYGKEGYENPNNSDDVYIVNEKTHTVYYVRGIEDADGNLYHYKKINENINDDNIPPTKPEIKVISGIKNNAGVYITELEIEIIPGKSGVSEIDKTTYSMNNSAEADITTLENNILKLTEDGTYTIQAKTYDENGNVSEEMKDIEIEVKYPQVAVGNTATENSTINGRRPSWNNPTIPVGFTAINERGAEWDADSGPEVTKGLVIKDNNNNQFVWIPVQKLDKFAVYQKDENSKDINGRINYRGVLYDWKNDATGEKTNPSERIEPRNDKQDNTTTLPSWTETLYQESFNSMVESVKRYQGFYVGRYETSLNGTTAQSKEGETPATAATTSADRWYGFYTKSKAYATSNTSLGVVSEMIWGCQYDAMLKFILTGADSSHVNVTGNVAHGTSEGVSAVYPTGNTNYPSSATVVYNDIASNIYDLEGNVFEWTQEEAGTTYRTFRGGNSGTSNSPCSRTSLEPTATWVANVGSRLSLYIK